MTEGPKFKVFAKVAGIVAQSQISFNAGTNQGIKVGDEAVLRRAVEVRDPETNEHLGDVYFPRLTLTVNLASEKFCVAVVTDRVTTYGFAEKGPIRRLKTVTLDPAEESISCLLVTVGESALFTRPPVSKDDD